MIKGSNSHIMLNWFKIIFWAINLKLKILIQVGGKWHQLYYGPSRPNYGQNCRFQRNEMVNSDLNCRNVLIDPKSIQDPKMISIPDEIIKIGKKKKKKKKKTFHDPPQTPPQKSFFGWHSLIFQPISLKKGVKMFRRSYCIKYRTALRNLKHTLFLPLYSPPLLP